MKKVFYCDFDGIIVNAKKRLIELYNLNYRPLGESLIDYKTATTWDCGIPPHLVEPIFSREDFFSYKLEIFDGAEKGLQILNERGYDVILYSKGSMKNLGHKLLWSNQWLNGLFAGWHLSGSNNLKMVKNQLDMFVPKEEGFSISLDDCYTNLFCNNDHQWKHHMPTYSICGKLSGKDVIEEWNSKWANEDMTIYHWNELSDILDKIENFEGNIIR